MKMKVNPETFVNTWMQAHRQGHNQSWVAEQLGIGRTAVSMRANTLRERGVKLPVLVRYSSGESKRLNKLIGR